MLSLILAALIGAAQPQAADPGLEARLAACNADADRMRAAVAFFALDAGQTIAEVEPNFILTNCLADAVAERGSFLMLVEGGNRIVNVSRRLAAQKMMKKDPARYATVPLVEIGSKKALPADRLGKVDRFLIVGAATAIVAQEKSGIAMLQSLRQLAGPDSQLGVIDLPDGQGVDVARLVETATAAGWALDERKIVEEQDGLLLLRFKPN